MFADYLCEILLGQYVGVLHNRQAAEQCVPLKRLHEKLVTDVVSASLHILFKVRKRSLFPGNSPVSFSLLKGKIPRPGKKLNYFEDSHDFFISPVPLQPEICDLKPSC